MITGASGGIGKAVALALAITPVSLVLVARNRERARAVAAQVSARGSPPPEVILADLSSLADVRRAAALCRAAFGRVDVLVNNVGGLFARRRTTVEGHEYTLALNHLCPFLLTGLLLPELRATGGRVVNVSSVAHRTARLDLRDLESTRSGMGPFGMGAYGRSKLMNLLFTYELARREAHHGITVNAMHPGVVASRFGRNNGAWMSAVLTLVAPFLRSVEQGADTAVYLATSAEVEGISGRYFVDRRPVPSSPASYDRDLQRGLWAETARITRLKVEPAAGQAREPTAAASLGS